MRRSMEGLLHKNARWVTPLSRDASLRFPHTGSSMYWGLRRVLFPGQNEQWALHTMVVSTPIWRLFRCLRADGTLGRWHHATGAKVSLMTAKQRCEAPAWPSM